jgi:hypothetical protein
MLAIALLLGVAFVIAVLIVVGIGAAAPHLHDEDYYAQDDDANVAGRGRPHA